MQITVVIQILFIVGYFLICNDIPVRFAQVKKCTNEGRALMQLDFQQFRIQLEKMSNIRLALYELVNNILL